MKPIPITVFTGFLGSGKTTTILSLLPQLPKDYKVVLLKNEFGDIEVDSQLAKQSSLAAVSEILNGCMCCILVGQMKNALLEIKDAYSPDRIIIETSGSAFPATLAFQIRELEKESNGAFKLDAIVTVVDAENFTGYEDKSPTAKMQAAYTDVILINKWELISERQLDLLMDELFTLNETTLKVKCNGRSGVDPSLIFGLDSKLFFLSASQEERAGWMDGPTHQEEVETVTIRTRGLKSLHIHDENCDHSHNEEAVSVPHSAKPLTRKDLESALATVNKETVYRVKGFIKLHDNQSSPQTYILNWAFGRFELTEVVGEIADQLESEEHVRFTVMGERGEVRKKAQRLADALGVEVS